MNILFNLDYHTTFGETLVVNIRQGSVTTACQMGTVDGHQWTCRFTPSTTAAQLDYYYTLHRGGREVRREWTTVSHRLELSARQAATYTVYDRWNDIPEDSYLYSSAFTDCLDSHALACLPESAFGRTVRLTVRCPQLRTRQRLAVVGSCEALGAWNPVEAVEMTEHALNEWTVDLDADRLGAGEMEFKFVALDGSDDNMPLWETSSNRTLALPTLKEGEAVVYQLGQAFMPAGPRRLAGTLVPVFSLRTAGSFGVGDFGDLRTMVDYVERTGQHVLQVLPINDTTFSKTWTDSYPYSCISVFALHPQYADLRQLPEPVDEAARQRFAALREELNALPQVDYERVNRAKDDYLRLLFAQEGRRVMHTDGFRQFFAEAEHWLVPYAAYRCLAEKYGTSKFTDWPDHRQWDEAERERLSNPRTAAYREVSYWYFVQYVLDSQLRAVHDYARSKHVVLKGDIPIGVARYGCDVWTEPQYFNLDGSAGAPPDDFSADGQNWGFPTYNWPAMLKDGCGWWVRRFRNMTRFFDAYRIDHVLGFFRIWEIPVDAVSGMLGRFVPALGMTREEIEAYGLPFLEEQFCEPFVSDWVIDRVFGDLAGEAKEKYLDHAHDDIWHVRPAYDTQRKVEQAFAGSADGDDKARRLRDGLNALLGDVLFIRDKDDAGKFHPRIAAQYSFTYEALYDNDKAAFNRLYNDYFYRRNNQFWYYEAMKKLPRLVQATRMLVCAEDLGMVPDCVQWVINELRILSLEIQSMPKDPNVRFGHLSRNPYRSVCTFSTHDMPTLRQWWDEDEERTQDYYRTMLHRDGAAPHPLPGWLARDIVSRQLTSPSMLCILSIQDWLAVDERLRLKDAGAERINVPAEPHHYWRYRMHLNIEDLMADEAFTANVRDLVKESDR